MLFVLGCLAGLVTAVLVFLILTFFRTQVERKVTVIERFVASKGPRPKGALIEPEDEGDVARRGVIEHNNKLGRATHIDEIT
jgi:hypothetical protein